MINGRISIGPVSVDTQTLIVGAVTVFIALSMLVAGYQIGKQPKEVVCKEEFEMLHVLKRTVESLKVRKHGAVMEAAQSCMGREQNLCDDRIKEVRDRITKLRCRICEGVK
jgi:hypothetical protein